MSQMIERDPAAVPHVKQFAAVISAAAADLTRMVEDVVTRAQLDAGRLPLRIEELDAVEETEWALKIFECGIDRLAVRCEPGMLNGDRSAIRQVLRNLVSNAVRYGGDRIDVLGNSSERSYRWTVRDDGPGLPQNVSNRVFGSERALVSVPDGDRGVGLGLGVATELVRRMGGALQYRRTAGVTEFSFTIPHPHAEWRTNAPLVGAFSA
jgi:two-component system phosphate regulon sensor histidine kinase PhoR